MFVTSGCISKARNPSYIWEHEGRDGTGRDGLRDKVKGKGGEYSPMNEKNGFPLILVGVTHEGRG